MAGKFGNLKSWLSNKALENLEIIIVEDKADSATSLELNELLGDINSPNIKFISGKFGAPGLSRNAGKDVASGKWITFWDADDKGYPEVALKAIGELSERSMSNLLVFSFDIRDWTSKEILKEKRIDLQNSSLAAIIEYPGIWRMCFRADFLKDLHFPNYKMAEDQVFFAHVIQKAPNIEYFDTKLYSYFKNVPGQLTNSSKAISDLVYSTDDISGCIKTDPNNQFFLELFVRQCFSGIKYGNLKEKIMFTLKIIKFLILQKSLLRIKVVSKVIFS
jgi:glycosyltransferase involved in cell wall biosynthesis